LHLLDKLYPKSKYIFITEDIYIENDKKKYLTTNNIEYKILNINEDNKPWNSILNFLEFNYYFDEL